MEFGNKCRHYFIYKHHINRYFGFNWPQCLFKQINKIKNKKYLYKTKYPCDPHGKAEENGMERNLNGSVSKICQAVFINVNIYFQL